MSIKDKDFSTPVVISGVVIFSLVSLGFLLALAL